MKKHLFISSILILFTLNSFANPDTLKSFPIQFNFLSPIGSHGIYSTEYQYNFSIGILGNRSGGIKGFETAGFFNYTKTNMSGFQTSGLFNWVKDEVSGIQITGLGNYAKKSKGVQISGGFNIAKEGFKGLQIGGLVSTANNKTYQINKYDFSTQISGLYSKGIGFNQFVQISGLVSIGDEIKSTQIAGLVNISKGNEGAQIAGIYNQSKKVKGIQIGFMNIADSVEGFQIGAINKSKLNGKYAYEIGVSDVQNIYFNYRSGVNTLYNFLNFGLQYNNGINWSYGYGIGVYLKEKSKYRTFTEVSAYHITENKLWERRYSNFLLSYAYGFEFGKEDNKNIRITPSFNLYLAKTKDGRLQPYPETSFPYYSLVAKTTRTDVHMWLGLKVSKKINI